MKKLIETKVFFIPDALSDSAMAETMMKRSMFGAVFLPAIPDFDSKIVQIVWEASLVLDPPAHVRPTRPKCWLTGVLHMQADKYYKVSIS